MKSTTYFTYRLRLEKIKQRNLVLLVTALLSLVFLNLPIKPEAPAQPPTQGAH